MNRLLLVSNCKKKTKTKNHAHKQKTRSDGHTVLTTNYRPLTTTLREVVGVFRGWQMFVDDHRPVGDWLLENHIDFPKAVIQNDCTLLRRDCGNKGGEK